MSLPPVSAQPVTAPVAAPKPAVPPLDVQVAGVPDYSKSQRARLTEAISLDNQLVGDAVTKLGGTPVPATSLKDLSGYDGASSTGLEPDRTLRIPLGTRVSDGPESTWNVVGVDGANLRLARRNPVTNAIEQAVKGVGELVDRSRKLVETSWTDAQGKPWQIIANPDNVRTLGRGADALIVDYKKYAAAEKAQDEQRMQESVVETNWGTILDQMQPTKRTIAVKPASEQGAIDLRRIVGDDTLVVSGIGARPGGSRTTAAAAGRNLLVATNSVPAGAADALAGAATTEQWFAHDAGTKLRSSGEPLVIRTDQPDFVANAAASVGYDGTRKRLSLYEGPRSEPVRQSVLNELPNTAKRPLQRRMRQDSDLVKEKSETVRFHEAGHISNGTTWGAMSRANAEVVENDAAGIETAIVDEAFADLFGLARTGEANLGFRNMASLKSDWSTLANLRRTIAEQGDDFDEHDGTQLITRPFVGLAKQLGHGSVADITGGANKLLASRLATGEIDVVDIPTAAGALHEAAASRYGIDAPAVKALHDEWSRLGVLGA